MTPTVSTPAAVRPPATSPYPPIADYAFLSDCHTGALVAPDGTIEWLCLPRFDSPSVFGALLDRGAGGFRFGPYGVNVPGARRYEPGTNILETTWLTQSGWVIVRDALTVGPWHDDEGGRHSDHVRAPTDEDADHLLVRTIECIQGQVQVELTCEPMFDYARTPATWKMAGDDWYAADATDGTTTIRLLSDLRIGLEGTIARARHTMSEGEKRFCALSWTEARGGPRTAEQADGHLDATSHFWRQWLNAGRFPDHRWRSYLQRSALTLKGLTYAPTGALVAAPTTSLPETPGGERNWDYRFSWMRDSTFTLWALHALGLDWEADDFMQYVADLKRNDDGGLQIMYGIGGERDLTEHELEHLNGYEEARPVRIGNGAFDQRQHDVYGAVLDSVYLHTKMSGRLPQRLWPVLEAQVECAINVWTEPDQGIWEARGAPQHYVSSKLMCWVALDRGARLAEIRGEPELAVRWQKVADEIHADICARGVDDRGVFCQHYGTKALDASVLLMPLVRFLPKEDPRTRATVCAIADEPLDLFAEELDAQSGRHLGNFPQAFTHLALINAVMHVIADEQAEE